MVPSAHIRQPMAPNGYLALILHAHLPYVRHPEYDEFLEEDWLYEAITETYLPLLSMLYGLADDGVPFHLTLTLTPPLCHMLRDSLAGQLPLRDVALFVSLGVFWLFLSVKVLEARKWSYPPASGRQVPPPLCRR